MGKGVLKIPNATPNSSLLRRYGRHSKSLQRGRQVNSQDRPSISWTRHVYMANPNCQCTRDQARSVQMSRNTSNACYNTTNIISHYRCQKMHLQMTIYWDDGDMQQAHNKLVCANAYYAAFECMFFTWNQGREWGKRRKKILSHFENILKIPLSAALSALGFWWSFCSGQNKCAAFATVSCEVWMGRIFWGFGTLVKASVFPIAMLVSVQSANCELCLVNYLVNYLYCEVLQTVEICWYLGLGCLQVAN